MMYFSMTHLLRVGEGPVVVVSFGVETVSMDRHTAHPVTEQEKNCLLFSLYPHTSKYLWAVFVFSAYVTLKRFGSVIYFPPYKKT